MNRSPLALVQCPGWGRECPPHALACLAAYAREAGLAASSFDLNNALYHASPASARMWEDKDYYSFWENPSRVRQLALENGGLLDSFVDRVLDSGARIVGFSTHTTSFLLSLEVARRIKARDRSAVVVFGGPQCSRAQAAEPLAREPWVDAVVVGEGEATLVELAREVERTGRVVPMPGLLLKTETGVRDCGDRELLPDLDKLPIPDYSDFASEMREGRYASPWRLEIFDSRGCVRTCDFCSEWQYWRRFRTKSGERMFEEVAEQMRRHPHVRHFYFIGSLLNGSLRSLERFCDLMLESGLKATWEGQAIVNPKMDRRLLSKMAAAGCAWLGFGVESGSERVRWSMSKKFTNDNAFETLRAAHEAGIRTQVNIMFGLPGETREDFEETLKFLARNRPNIDTVLASQSFTVVDKGTKLHARPEAYGIEGQDHHLYWSSNGGENDYLERFRRYEEFCRVALELGLPETSGVLREKPDKWLLIGEYHMHRGDWAKAVRALRRSLRKESYNKTVLAEVAECYARSGRAGRARLFLRKALELRAPDGRPDPYDEELSARLSGLPSEPAQGAALAA